MIKLRSTLSLFNGIGVGARALKNIGAEVGTCYVSEIDKIANMTNYTAGVSNTQRYKQCGNGWTLPVIEHIFSEAYKE